jgi:2,4-dienoyl-CoA reductase-like NADH-dependent reductase (Old Yellow Enzyme family)
MAGGGKFPRLLEPGHIGSVRTRNRLLKTGATPGFYPWEDGYFQEEGIGFFEALAKGGAGIVTVGALSVFGNRAHDDKYIRFVAKWSSYS